MLFLLQGFSESLLEISRSHLAAETELDHMHKQKKHLEQHLKKVKENLITVGDKNRTRYTMSQSTYVLNLVRFQNKITFYGLTINTLKYIVQYHSFILIGKQICDQYQDTICCIIIITEIVSVAQN